MNSLHAKFVMKDYLKTIKGLFRLWAIKCNGYKCLHRGLYKGYF